MRPQLARFLQAGMVVVTAGCASDPPAEVGELSAELTPVSWTDEVGVNATGNDLVKTAPETAFNAGAVSVQTLAGDGFVEFSTAENTTDKLAGLSVGNGGQGYKDIDFAIRLNASGHASVYEGGVNRGGIGVYSAGDLFRVQAQDGVVTYWRNGKLKYTSALAPSFPLLVDTSLKTPGATLTDVVIEPIDFWTAGVNVSVNGNDITKTAPEDQYNAGAISLATIASGDGFVEFRAGDATSIRAAGLGTGNSNTSRTDIEFAISLNDTGGVSVYESGAFRGAFGVYQADDVFRVEVAGGVVRYLHNRVVFYTSAVAPTYPLVLDTAIRTPGASILAAKLVSGYLTDDCALQESSIAAPGLYAIAAAGDLLVVGQRMADPPVANVYRQIDGVWTFEQTLSNPDPTRDFGGRVATDGETIAVGIGGLQGVSGSVQVYRQDTGGVWVEDIRLEPCPGGQFGLFTFAVRGDLLVVSETFDERVHVYRRVNGVWGLEAFLTPTGGSSIEYFGLSLAIGGDRIFAAAPLDDPNGEVYIFRYMPSAPQPPAPTCDAMNQGKWQQKLRLVPPAGHGYDNLDADATGTRLLIGDRNDAHLFELAAGVWSETRTFVLYPASEMGEVHFGGPGPDAGSVAVMGPGIYADLSEGWDQIDTLASRNGTAVAASAVFRRAQNAVEVYSLDPVCLAE